MSRRSSRLVSGGYYNSDEESDSSSVTNISYRENPVKVFKKKAGARKAGSRTPSRANSNASSPSNESPITAGLTPSPLSSQTQPIMRTVPYLPPVATPRPALTPSSSRSQTPTLSPSVSPEKCPVAGPCISSRSGLHHRPNHKELTQSSVDSSGYSSSEGPQRKPTAASGDRIHGNSVAPGAGYRSRMSRAFSSLMDSVSLMAVAAKSKIANTSLSSHMKKKACVLFLLLLFLLLCIWLLPPLLNSLFSRMTVTKTPSQTKPQTQPVIPATPPSQLNTVHPTPVVDPAVVSAAVEVKMQHFMAELQQKQQELLLRQEQLLTQDPAVVSAAVEAKMQHIMAELQRKQQELQLRQEQLLTQDPAVVSAAVEAKMQHVMEELQQKQQELQLRQEHLLTQDPAVVSAAVEAKMQQVMEELQRKQQELQLRQEHLLTQDPAVVSVAVEAKMQHVMEELQQKQQELQLRQEHLLTQDPAVVSVAVEAKMQHVMEELQRKQQELQLRQEHLLTQDPAVVSAAVEVKMQHVMEELQRRQQELQLRQEQLLTQMKEKLQLEMQDMKARLEVEDSDSRLRLEQQLAGVDRQLADHQTDSHSSAASLSLRIQALEAQNAQLSQEWSTFQLKPPPAPCPDTSNTHDRLTPELQQAVEKWLTDRIREQDAIRLADRGSCSDCGRPMADKMADFALETQGASVISTRCSETYRIRSACVTLFGFPLWYPSESPRTVIQGYPLLLPGKCWAFHGVQGTLVISLSHPITITHVTLDHLPRYNSPTGRIDSAPKDFEVYGMKDDTEEGTLLGTFTYNENGESTQTFKLPKPSDVVYRFVELRVLTNWGHVEYTCLYRFRVHGQMSST